MTNSACWREPIIRIARMMMMGLGQKYSAIPIAAARTVTSCKTASEARHADRRVRRATTSFGSAFLKSSLNSSPFTSFSLLDAAHQDVLRLHVLLESVLGALAAQPRLLH